jgi:hypothetical protein
MWRVFNAPNSEFQTPKKLQTPNFQNPLADGAVRFAVPWRRIPIAG